MALTDMLRGRQVIHTLTNKYGASVALGDVVVIGDGTNDNCFTTTTTASFNARAVGVAQETIANNAAGRVLLQGYTSIVNTSGAVTRDHFLFTHTVAKESTGSATRAAGAFGQILESGTDPEAVIWGMPDGTTGAETLAATIVDAKGDLITATAADTPARLAVGANGTRPEAASGESTGIKWSYPPGYELDYVEKTSDVSVTGTNEAGAQTYVSSTSIAYDGSTVIVVEAFIPNIVAASTAEALLDVVLFDGATALGIIGRQRTSAAAANGSTCYARRRLTPSAASHQYHVKCYVSSGTGTATGGNGTTGNWAPGFIRIVRV